MLEEYRRRLSELDQKCEADSLEAKALADELSSREGSVEQRQKAAAAMNIDLKQHKAGMRVDALCFTQADPVWLRLQNLHVTQVGGVGVGV